MDDLTSSPQPAPVDERVKKEIQELVNQATTTGKYTIATVCGIRLGAWPYTKVDELVRNYCQLK